MSARRNKEDAGRITPAAPARIGVWRLASRGGRRQGAKRPQMAGAGAKVPRPSHLVWQAGGQRPPAAKRRRPPPGRGRPPARRIGCADGAGSLAKAPPGSVRQMRKKPCVARLQSVEKPGYASGIRRVSRQTGAFGISRRPLGWWERLADQIRMQGAGNGLCGDVE